MFYEQQASNAQALYKTGLKNIGYLSRWFSDSESPFLYYRAHENIFASCFGLQNNARSDDSADAYSVELKIGIGLKTWVGSDNQKIAEFGRLRPSYKDLAGLELVKTIAQYRNKRIQTTKRAHGLETLVYHIVKRVPGEMLIYEHPYDEIDVEHLEIQPDRGSENSTYFFDGKHFYHFSSSKNTLYMDFSGMELLDTISVEIAKNPFTILESSVFNDLVLPTMLTEPTTNEPSENHKELLCLRLYSTKTKTGEKYIPKKSGLNQWNGSRTHYIYNENGERSFSHAIPRDPNELYIPYPAEDRSRKVFFPSRDIPFTLRLPNGQEISAKVSQQDGKAIMSKPNSALGKWLLRDVFNLPEGTLVTYEMLKEFNIDSVMFEKVSESEYKVDFCELGTYEKFYSLTDKDSGEDSE